MLRRTYLLTSQLSCDTSAYQCSSHASPPCSTSSSSLARPTTKTSTERVTWS